MAAVTDVEALTVPVPLAEPLVLMLSVPEGEVVTAGVCEEEAPELNETVALALVEPVWLGDGEIDADRDRDALAVLVPEKETLPDALEAGVTLPVPLRVRLALPLAVSD